MQLDVQGAILFLTHDCNLRCDYCFDFNQRGRPGLEPAVAAAALDWLLANTHRGTLGLGLFGGEPLLRPDLIRWLLPEARSRARAAGKKITFSVATNGTLLTGSLAALLKEHRVRIQLSADGTRAAQDAHRRFVSGVGSFATVATKYRLILDACPTAAVRMTVTPRNAEFLAESVAYYLGRGFRRVSPTPMYEEEWTDSSLAVYREQLDQVGAILVREILAGRVDLEIGGLTGEVRGFASRSARKRACGAGHTMVAIDTDGTIYPCHRFIGYTNRGTTYRLGHVSAGLDAREDPLRGLLVKDMAIAGTAGGDCPRCGMETPLTSGCAAMNVATTGHPLVAPDVYGRFEKIRAEITRSVVEYLLNRSPRALESYLEASRPHARSGGAGRGSDSGRPHGVTALRGLPKEVSPHAQDEGKARADLR